MYAELTESRNSTKLSQSHFARILMKLWDFSLHMKINIKSLQ